MYNEPDATNTAGVQQTKERERPQVDIRRSDLPGMVGLISIIVIVGIVWTAHYHVNEHSASIKFATEAIFSFFALIVIIFQVVIYWQQTEIMGITLMVGNRSQMDVDKIRLTEINGKPKIVIKIGNIGHIPADEIKVWVDVFFQISDKCKKPISGARKKCQQGYFWDFGTSKLFPGKLRLKLFVPIQEHFSKELEVPSGEARIIAQIRIANKDGFGRWESQFAFRLDAEGTGWIIYPVRSSESLLRDLYEDDQPKYYDPKQPNPN